MVLARFVIVTFVCTCMYIGDIFSCHAVDNPDLQSEKVINVLDYSFGCHMGYRIVWYYIHYIWM